jgi:hypothetical protein
VHKATSHIAMIAKPFIVGMAPPHALRSMRQAA